MAFAGVSARDALDSALIAIKASGVDSPQLDAELLVAHALGVDRVALRIDPDRELDAAGTKWLRDAVQRRAVRREPLAYIVGTKGFRHIDLSVDRRVLIPRPETEHLVEAALELPAGASVHEVGTGSGAVALALKQERPDLTVTASDISAEALEVARANASRLGLDVAMHAGSLLAGVSWPVDAVISNPPYVPAGDKATLAPEITRHEPELALYGGDDGLDVVRALLAEAADTAASFVALEIGAGQDEQTADLMVSVGFGQTDVIEDLAGIGRVVVGRR